MPVVNVADLQNAKLDVDHIADLATSPAPTATDRLGQTKKTWSGIVEELEAEAAITETGLNRSAAEGAAVAAAASAALAAGIGRRRAIFFLSDGQSNSNAQGPLYSTEQVDGLVTFNGGQQPDVFADYLNSTVLMQNLPNFGSLVDHKETAAKEGWGTGVAVQLRQIAGVDKVLYFSAGALGLAYTALSEGTSKFNDKMLALISGVKLLRAQGYALDDIVPVHQWAQGEAEASALGTLADEYITAAQETTALRNLAASVNRAWSIAFGRPTVVSIFLWPIQATKLHAVAGPNVQEGQLTASNTVPGIIMLTNPCQFTADMNADLVHFGGYGKRLMAEAHGLIMRKVLSGEAWKPLQIVTATRAGAVTTANFNKTIAIDTTTFAEVSAVSFPKQKYGFQVFDTGAGGAELTISSVTVLAKAATITTSTVPVGPVKLRLSQHQIGAGTPSAVLARSNIRAVTPIGVSSDGVTIQDVAVPQGITVA